MTLKQQIDEDIKNAMRAKAQDTLRALRAIKAMILMEETKPGAPAEIAPEDELKILTRAAKQRRDSAAIYQEQNRPDLLQIELAEIAVIEQYLPKQLSEDDIKAKIAEIIARVGATSAADMGKIMGPAMKELAGQADGKAIQAAVKGLLG